MKRKIIRILLSILLLAMGANAGAMAETAEEPLPQAFIWWGHNLIIDTIEVDPEKIVNNPSPETQRYVYIHFNSPQKDLTIEVVVESLSSLRLVAPTGEEYPGAAYMPHAIIYNESNGVFTTAFEQPSFDVLFVVPREHSIESFSLRMNVDEDTEQDIAFSDPQVAVLIEYGVDATE